MPSLKNLLPIALSLAATTQAATCPKDWFSNTFHVQRCCFGGMTIVDTTAFCCVYDTNPVVWSTTASSTATTSLDDDMSWTTSTGDDCFTKIPFTATNYSDLVSSASSRLLHTSTVASNEATATASSAGSSSASPTPNASSTSSGAAMPIATAHEVIMGGAAVVAGLLAL